MADFRLHLTEEQYAELAQFWHEYTLLGPRRSDVGLDRTGIALHFSEWIDADEDEPHYGLPEIAAFFDEKDKREGTVVGMPPEEAAIALLRALGGNERIVIERLRDLCQHWLDTGKWLDEE